MKNLIWRYKYLEIYVNFSYKGLLRFQLLITDLIHLSKTSAVIPHRVKEN